MTLAKHMARKGWVLAINTTPKGPGPLVGTLVLRGASSAKDKEIKSISSRLIGMLMGSDTKPRIDRKAGRVMVVVPRGPAADAGWVWWPEKDDLIIGFAHPTNAEAITAAIDGKAPSAADHPVLKELSSPEGSFVPLMTAMVDPGAIPAASGTKLAETLEKIKTKLGVTRLDYRWGFDDDALMGVARLVAPAPRKPLLAIFSQPPLDTSKLIPIPEGVDSFVMVSAAPAKVAEAVNQIGLPASWKEQIDELTDKVKAQSRVDFEKDLLANLGPRMALYLRLDGPRQRPMSRPGRPRVPGASIRWPCCRRSRGRCRSPR